ncbi:methyltransferase [Mangrovimicrobium sediminis]|uniref:Methyltransferase n=1 Tax=Mangrovimicrobium sediminis TaxID=2562682 RepID=A0A4Z0LWK4_9GAMM|nr:methyltransferase [Haliea sp. SAOS-164]
MKPAAATLALSLFVAAAPVSAASSVEESIEKAATAGHRSAENIARNQYRHPVETLSFFGLEPDMTVIEISPGSLWYTEVLAPVLKDHGKYIAAGYDSELPGQPEYRYRQTAAMEKRFAEEAQFSKAEVLRFSPPQVMELGAPGSADMVLTFRNTHGWIREGIAAEVFGSFFKVLKPGGVLGVVQHRGPSVEGFTGYVTEAQVIKLAQDAGFVLEDFSEVNANPADTKDYEQGVWTLPPSLRLGDTDRDRYLAIGESDRMTLRFRKPRY